MSFNGGLYHFQNIEKRYSWDNTDEIFQH